jgi:hypothetical protein
VHGREQSDAGRETGAAGLEEFMETGIFARVAA